MIDTHLKLSTNELKLLIYFQIIFLLSHSLLFRGMAPALEHNDVLKKICGLCYRKNKNLRNITGNFLCLTKTHHHTDYNICSGYYSKVVCPPCQRALKDIAEASKKNEQSKRKLPLPKYDTMKRSRSTRSNSDGYCCGWCDVWRKYGGPHNHYMKVNTHIGRPVETPPPPPAEARKKCDVCHSEMKRGLKHVCSIRTMEENVQHMLNAIPEKSRQRS